MFNRYSNALIQKPFKTKMLTAGVLSVGGDFVCQKYIEKREIGKNYDYRRTMNLFLIGSLVSAPLIHLWYVKGAPAICRHVTQNAKLYPYISLAADQTLIATSTLALFLFLSEYMQNFNAQAAVYNVRRKFWSAITTNWKVWPPIILINFLFVPLHFRVLFTNLIGFFWGIYLTYFQYNT